VIAFYILTPHCECPNPLGENIEKEVRHPEQSEGSPDVREMSRKARHDVLLIELALKSSWEKLRLMDLALALNIDLNTIRYFFSDKDHIIDGYFDQADEEMLRLPSKPEFTALSPKEKLHTLLMTWLKTFEGKQKLVRQMLAHKLEPGHLHLQFAALKRISQTVQWWREAAGLTATFPSRAFEESALTMVYLLTFSYWLFDNSRENSATARFLEKKLNKCCRFVCSLQT